MWLIKRANADYYYSHYDINSDLPIYTKEVSKAKVYKTKAAAKNDMRTGDILTKQKEQA